MNRLWFLVIPFLFVSGYCDVEPEYYILPVKIHYKNRQKETAWVEYNAARFYLNNPEYDGGKRPIPGKKVLFLNKLDSGDSLTISRKFYTLPDKYKCLITERISLKEIELIEECSSDSLRITSGWSSLWVKPEIGDLLINQKPVFVDLIVTEDEGAYAAEHVYCYDSSLTKETVRKLYKSGGRENKILKKAILEKRIVFIEEITP